MASDTRPVETFSLPSENPDDSMMTEGFNGSLPLVDTTSSVVLGRSSRLQECPRNYRDTSVSSRLNTSVTKAGRDPPWKLKVGASFIVLLRMIFNLNKTDRSWGSCLLKQTDKFIRPSLIFKTLPWLFHDSFMTLPWLFHDSWHIHDTFMTCSLNIHEPCRSHKM